MPESDHAHDLAVQQPHELAHAPQASAPSLDMAMMLKATLEKGISAENVAVVEKMLDLVERQEARNAEKAFTAAFVALQREMPRVQAKRIVPDRDGNQKFKFAPYEEIMAQVQPLLLRHGFAVSFSMKETEGRITQTCTLTHTAGHARTNEFTVRIGKGPPGASEAQSDGSASTYAKRFALCNALNIIIEQDNDGAPPDAAIEGQLIPPDKVLYLREQVKERGADEARFLKLAGVTSFDKITEGVYPILTRFLESKRGASAPQS